MFVYNFYLIFVDNKILNILFAKKKKNKVKLISFILKWCLIILWLNNISYNIQNNILNINFSIVKIIKKVNLKSSKMIGW